MSKKKHSKKNNRAAIIFLIIALIVGALIIVNLPKDESIPVSETENEAINDDDTIAKDISTPAPTSTPTPKKEIVNELKDGLPVLMYHFFYDNVTYWPEDTNWLYINDFEEHLKYLTENDFYFPTWEEVEEYIDGTAKLPEKSVVITVDDGDASFFDLAVPMLQKYKVPATIFVITEWYGWRYDKDMAYVNFQSHSHSMHEAGANGKGRIVNWSKEEILEDIEKNRNEIGYATVFCYPFGHYNDTAIEALKEAGFKLAFTIEGGRVYPGDNKFALPRVRVTAGNSLNYFKSSVE